MLQKQQIIIQHHKHGKSQREVHRQTGISRKTIRKYIRQYEKELELAQHDDSVGIVTSPTYDTSGRSPSKMTEEIRQEILECLRENERKLSRGQAKQRMKAIDIHEYLRTKEYDIGYSSVCNFIRHYRQSRTEVFVRQDPQPGQVVEFDWGEVKVRIDGKMKTLYMATFTLAYSNYRWACLFYRQDMSSFLLSHVLFFMHLGYVPGQVVYDNMRTAVRRFTLKNADKVPTDDLLKLSAYYLFEYRFCNAGKGNEKGHVEKSVEFVRRKAFCRHDDFESIEQANKHLQDKTDQLNQGSVRGSTISIAQQAGSEKEHMRCAPVSGYDVGEMRELKTDKYHCICVDNNHYSVPESHPAPFVHVKVYPLSIHIYGQDSQRIATHERRHDQHTWCIDIWHYLDTLRKKPGALHGSAALNQASGFWKKLYQDHFIHAPKDFIELLNGYKSSEYLLEEWIKAAEQCRKATPHQAPGLDKISLLLQRNRTENSNSGLRTEEPSSLHRQIQTHCHHQLQQAQQLLMSPHPSKNQNL